MKRKSGGKSEIQSEPLKRLFTPRAAVAEQEELSEKQKLVRRILARRDVIAARTGTLPESYPLIREDRER